MVQRIHNWQYEWHESRFIPTNDLYLAVSKLVLWLIFVPPTRLLPASISMRVIYRSQNDRLFTLIEYSLASISSFILHNGLVIYRRRLNVKNINFSRAM